MKISLVSFLFWGILLLTHQQVKGQQIQEEKVYVHLHKTIAIAGETIWFRLNVVNPLGDPYSKVTYGELVDREGKPVQQSLFTFDKGILEGNMDVPEDLMSDHYLLRFYTRTSPFLGPEGVDSQFITVINPKKPNPNQLTSEDSDTFSVAQKPKTHESLIAEKSFPKGTGIPIDLKDFEGKNMQLAVSLQNPFISEDSKGRMNGDIYQPLSEKLRLIPEPYGHVVHGKNLAAQVDTTETFFLSAHGSQSVLNTTKPKLNGDLFFDLGPLKSYNYFIIQSSKSQEQLNFSLQSPFLELKFTKEFSFPAFHIGEKNKEFLMDLILASQLAPYFYSSSKQDFNPIVTGFVVDKTYHLDDYNRFDKLETVLREYVPEVSVRKQNKKTLFKVLNNPIGAIFDQNPLLLVDAMPIFDTDVLANFDPQKIRKLEVLAREFYLNEDKFAGVMSFSSFDNDFGGFPLPTTALYLTYPLIQNPKVLQSPHFNPHLSEPRYPDFRTALYWASVKGDTKEIQAYSSQTAGTFELVLSFINEKGEFETIMDTFQVVN